MKSIIKIVFISSLCFFYGNVLNAQAVNELDEVTVNGTNGGYQDWSYGQYSNWLDGLFNGGYNDDEYDPGADIYYDYNYSYPADPGSTNTNNTNTNTETTTTPTTTNTPLDNALALELGTYSTNKALMFPAIEVRAMPLGVNELEIGKMALQVATMPNAELGNLVAIYNSTLDDGSNAVNAGDVKLENENNVANNTEPSANTTEFNNWLSDILFIQMSAQYNYVEVYDCYNYSNSCDSNENENDDFVGFAQQDPFFINNPDDPWRLKKFLSPDSYYITGLAAGVGDGLIEAADTVYTLVKFSANYNSPSLMARIITDFEGLVQEAQDKLEMTKDLIKLIHDPVLRAQVVNAIESAMVNWFDQVVGNKTWAEMGYQHGKLLVEVAGMVVGITEIKLLLKTGQFSATALSAIRKIDGVIQKGFKFAKVDGVTSLVDDAGEVLAHGVDNAKELVERIAKWTNVDGTIKWPPGNGFDGVINNINLPVGLKIDRYGPPTGKFTSPQGTSFGERALYPGTTRQLSTYQVIQPIPAKSGKALPWFDEIGGGTQYEFDNNIQWLLDNNYLIEI